MQIMTPSVSAHFNQDEADALDLGLPRFSLNQNLFIASFRTRFPISFSVRVAYLLPLRKDGTYHYFVMPRDTPADSAALPADMPAGAWVHETDLSTEPPVHRTMKVKAKKG